MYIEEDLPFYSRFPLRENMKKGNFCSKSITSNLFYDTMNNESHRSFLQSFANPIDPSTKAIKATALKNKLANS
jgi:hypothetical protein